MKTYPKNLLYKALLAAKDEQECKSFIRDLCTPQEIKSFEERLLVAYLLEEKITYRKISETTGSSTATITRVAQWLNNGEGGYKIILQRLKNK